MNPSQPSTDPVTRQVLLTMESLREASEDGTFTQANFPSFDPAYLEYWNRQINWEQTPHKGPEDKERILRSVALEQLWTALRRRGVCSNSRVGDRGLYAAFALKPPALKWPEAASDGRATVEDVPLLVKYLGYSDYEVRKRAAELLGRLGPAARAAVPALQDSCARHPGNVSSDAAREALVQITGQRVSVEKTPPPVRPSEGDSQRTAQSHRKWWQFWK